MVRLLLLWILIAALPLRGIAAEIALPCTMAHTSTATPGTGFADACDHPGAMRMPGSAAQEHAGAAAAHPDLHFDQGAHPAHASCRVCCACHVGVSAPPPFAASGAPAAHVVKDHLSPVSSIIGWIPSRIERPPRA